MVRSQPDPKPGRPPLTAFIVEDNQPARETLAELLTVSAGVTVIGQADSEMAATEWLGEHPGEWRVFITDLLLVPGGSGFPLIRRAKSQPEAGKVVVFSDFVTDAIARRCREFGADAVFRKSELEGLLAFVHGLDSVPEPGS
jgi:DNA-binding NarL/FixJ family response regulator